MDKAGLVKVAPRASRKRSRGSSSCPAARSATPVAGVRVPQLFRRRHARQNRGRRRGARHVRRGAADCRRRPGGLIGTPRAARGRWSSTRGTRRAGASVARTSPPSAWRRRWGWIGNRAQRHVRGVLGRHRQRPARRRGFNALGVFSGNDASEAARTRGSSAGARRGTICWTASSPTDRASRNRWGPSL